MMTDNVRDQIALGNIVFYLYRQLNQVIARMLALQARYLDVRDFNPVSGSNFSFNI